MAVVRHLEFQCFTFDRHDPRFGSVQNLAKFEQSAGELWPTVVVVAFKASYT